MDDVDIFFMILTSPEGKDVVANVAHISTMAETTSAISGEPCTRLQFQGVVPVTVREPISEIFAKIEQMQERRDR